MKNENLNRRDFLTTSFKAVAIGSLALSTLDMRKLMAKADLDKTSTTEKVINLSDYPDLGSVGGTATLGKTIVIRTGDSKFLAISLICGHKKCTVDYTGSGFECPCHGSAYDENGKVTNGPSTKNLKSYKTTYNSDDNTLTINM